MFSLMPAYSKNLTGCDGHLEGVNLVEMHFPPVKTEQPFQYL